MSGIFPSWLGVCTGGTVTETIIKKEIIEVDSGGGIFVPIITVTASIVIDKYKEKPKVKARLIRT
jgi:hypothetical protein